MRQGGNRDTSKLLMERSVPGRAGAVLPASDVPPQPLPDSALLRDELPLPEISEPEVVQYFTGLSQRNFSIDTHFYPLGSCTMKYNPKINDETAFLPGFAGIHPMQPAAQSQGALELLHRLQEFLGEITGLPEVSLATLAGAHGELAGMLMVKAYLQSRGETGRTKVAIPDSAHGTNPASAAMAGFQVVELASDSQGNVDLEALHDVADDSLAGVMITLPSTWGCSTPTSSRPSARPTAAAVPGAGPVCATERLAPYLAAPVVTTHSFVPMSGSDPDERQIGEAHSFYHLHTPEHSIGKLAGFHGNFGVLVRAYTYIRTLGAAGVTSISGNAVLNANYMMNALKDVYHLPYDRTCMHEAVFSADWQKARGAGGLEIAKRLLDYGFHAPTMYFPLIVPECLMIEPTESRDAGDDRRLRGRPETDQRRDQRGPGPRPQRPAHNASGPPRRGASGAASQPPLDGGGLGG
ncbi:Probable glycine dehydrogenase (decarboxylating) subunit 2 [Geodia barretti]|uniref:glycine dehydrogenase (aminomethyl-transferring) n=1 Tax=Geodia barretti TaxID=519541 RepID=A0AA35TBP7_GEOBA|nr:Probable glycine dehydrogenase (decarboxylating) subunit 2 [Geodia barretti]